jgi:Isoleucyl-tRNA synthetase
LRAFAVFVEEGLVYEAQKPVFWSTGAQTALAEAEVEYQDRDDTAVYVKFPIVGGASSPNALANASIAIWTTLPGRCRPISPSLWMQRELCRPRIFARWDF